MTHNPYAAAKTPLRAAARQARRTSVSGRDRASDAAAVTDAVLALVVERRVGDTVAAYESMGLEPPTESVIDALVARGLRVLVPITLEDSDLDWCDVTDPERKPLGAAAIGTAELVLVPASGVDPSGARLGRGGGSYDRALTRTTGLAVGVVWPWEVGPDPLPVEPHDRPVHAVLAVGDPVRLLGRSPGGG